MLHYGGYGIPDLTGSTIEGIEVLLDDVHLYQGSSQYYQVQLSWDGGTSWTGTRNTPVPLADHLPAADYLLGGPADLWGCVSWTAAGLSNANLKVRVIHNDGGALGGTRMWFDWVPVKIYYTPAPPSGHILVDKVTVPGGDPQVFTFDPSWSGTDFTLTDASAPHDSGPLAPGTYSVAETVPLGWALTSATCDDGSPVNNIDVAPGETVTCTFVDSKVPPGKATITVQKVAVGGDGTFSYTTTGGDGLPTTFSITTAGGSGQAIYQVDPGDYSVTESSLPTGWEFMNLACTGTGTYAVDLANMKAEIKVDSGQSVTCIYANAKPTLPARPPVGGKLYSVDKTAPFHSYVGLLGLLGAVATAVAITRGRKA